MCVFFADQRHAAQFCFMRPLADMLGVVFPDNCHDAMFVCLQTIAMLLSLIVAYHGHAALSFAAIAMLLSFVCADN